MSEYRVTWVIDIEADSALEAAEKARAIQLNPKSIANVFDVQERQHRREYLGRGIDKVMSWWGPSSRIDFDERTAW